MICETTTYKYGPSYLALMYTPDELSNLIGDFIKNNDDFSFTQLCNYILSLADKQGKLKKEPNTSYSQIYLTNADTITISKMLWGKIWSKELIILFNYPHEMYHNSNETFFVTCK